MVQEFNIRAIIKLTIEKILKIKLLSIIVYMNSKPLYNCLVKLSNTQKKWLMINLICL